MSKKKHKISTLGSQAASVVSVALVLLILGVIAMLGIATGRITNSVLGNVSVIVKVDPEATASTIDAIGSYIDQAPFVRASSFTSAQQVLEQEMEYNAEILELIDENPYSPEYELLLQPAYVNTDSINNLSNQLMFVDGVEEVVSQTDMVEAVDNAFGKLSLVLSGVAIVLLVISLVLIYNTVSIAVYGRRFVIRTMQLVGATGAFIRRPFVTTGVVWGVVAALIASALLVGAQAYISELEIGQYLNIPAADIAIVCAGMLVLGIAICGFATWLATNRYLRASDDKLYS